MVGGTGCWWAGPGLPTSPPPPPPQPPSPHLVGSPLLLGLHLGQQATAHHLHPGVAPPPQRAGPAVGPPLPGLVHGVGGAQLLRAVRAAAVVRVLGAGVGVPGLPEGWGGRAVLGKDRPIWVSLGPMPIQIFFVVDICSLNLHHKSYTMMITNVTCLHLK